MSSSDLWQAITSGIIYDIAKVIVGSLIMSAALTWIFRRIFNQLKERKEIISFAVAAFIMTMTLLFFIGPRTQAPNLEGGIQSVVTGANGGPNNDQNTFAILTMSVLNTGNMQSIIKDWNVEAVAGGNKYIGAFAPMPETIVMNMGSRGPDFPTSLTYKAEDNIVPKALTPIQPGALVPGTIFVIFLNVNPEAFKGGATFTVTYQDALSKTYAASIVSTAQAQPVGTYPGLHTVMACPLPNGQLPKFSSPSPAMSPPSSSPAL